MKQVNFLPNNDSIQVHTRQDLLKALLAKELKVAMSCGGKGLCATCHVYIEKGHEQLTPPTEQEKMTLGFISKANNNSRLACQCRILGDGVVVRLPEGIYIEKEEDLLDMIGKRAEKNILHPLNGEILIKKGKLITRSSVKELKRLNFSVNDMKK